VAGKRIELIVKDDASSGENGKRLIQELIVNEKVDVIGGGPTADLLPSAPLLTEAQKPAVIMISSTTAVEKSPYFVRTSGTLAQSSAIMADWAIRNGLGKAVTLVTEFAPGLEAEETFANNFKAAGGQIAEMIRVPAAKPRLCAVPATGAGCGSAGRVRVHSVGSGRHLRQAVRGARPRQGRHQADRARRSDRRRSLVEHG
jgi:ABC-type branched-subunit amino acid transport system substrate-binding protein